MLPLRTLLVDDSPEFLELTARYLSTEPGIEIVGCASSGLDALARVDEVHPDLVLMDVAIPGMNGLQATSSIKAQPHAPRIVILTLNDNAEYRRAAEAIGADGFIAKWEFGTQLLPLIYSLFA